MSFWYLLTLTKCKFFDFNRYQLISEYNLSSVKDYFSYKCTMKRKLQHFYVKENAKGLFDISIDPDMVNSCFIYYHVLSKNLSAVYSKKNYGKIHITDDINDSTKSIVETELKYLDNMEINLNVYSHLFYPKICPKKSNYLAALYICPIIIVAIGFGVFLHALFHKGEKIVTDFWFIPDSDKDSTKYINPKDKYLSFFMNRSLHISKLSGKTDSTVVRMYRHENSLNFERVASMPISNGYHMVFYWLESPGSPKSPHVSMSFTPDGDLTLTKEPEMTLSSFRNTCPVSVKMEFSNGVNAKLDLPTDFIAPFQPFGQLVTNAFHLLNKVSDLMRKGAFRLSNFTDCILEMNEVIRGKFVTVIGELGNIILKHSAADNFWLTDDEIHEYFNNLPQNTQQKFFDTYKGEIIYVVNSKDTRSPIQVMFVLCHEPINATFKTVGFSILIQCCLFVYNFAISKKQSLRYRNFMELIMKTNAFCYSEMDENLKTTVLKTSLFEHPYTIARTVESRFYMKDSSDTSIMVEAIRQVAKENTIMKQKKFAVNIENIKWISVSAMANIDPVTKKNIITIISKDITTANEKEDALIKSVADLEKADKKLGLYRFDIKDGKIIMETDQLFEKIGIDPPPNRCINSLIIDDQAKIIRKIEASYNTTFRINGNNGRPLWFAACRHLNNGCLFYLNNLITSGQELTINCPENMMCVSVDVLTGKITSFNGLPTLNELYGKDSYNNICNLLNAMPEEERPSFARRFLRLIKGSRKTSQMSIMTKNLEGKVQWVKFTMFRSNKEITVTGNTTKPPKPVDTAKDNIFKVGKLMPWSFENNYDTIPHSLNQFQPGISKIFIMNWWVVENFVENKEELRKEITHCMMHKGKFSFVCRIVIDSTSLSLLIQGENKNQSSNLIGFCMEANELYDELFANSEYLRKITTLKNATDSLLLKAQSIIYDTFSVLNIAAFQLDPLTEKVFFPFIERGINYIQEVLFQKNMPHLNTSRSAISLYQEEIDIIKLIETTLIYLSPIIRKHEFIIDADFQPEDSYVFTYSTDKIRVSIMFTLLYILKNATDNKCQLNVSYYNDTITISFTYIGRIDSCVTDISPIDLGYMIFGKNITVSLKIQSDDLRKINIAVNKRRKNKVAIGYVSDQFIAKQLLYVANSEINNGSFVFGVEELISLANKNEIDLLFVEEKADRANEIIEMFPSLKTIKKMIIIKDLYTKTPEDGKDVIYGPIVLHQAKKIILDESESYYSESPYNSSIQTSVDKRIMLICDDERKNQIIEMILTLLKCNYTVFTNYEEARNALNESSDKPTFDHLVIYYHPKNSVGLGFSYDLRKSNSVNANIPILFISQFENIDLMIPSNSTAAFYNKPMDPSEFADNLM